MKQYQQHLVSSGVSQARVNNWLTQAKSVTDTPTWTERRRAILFGEHVYLVDGDQVFQCAHCGRYDPKWATVEVLDWFLDNFGIKPIEIEVTCSVAVIET